MMEVKNVNDNLLEEFSQIETAFIWASNFLAA